MQEFNHKRIIRLVCSHNKEGYRLRSIKIDPEVRALLKRNSFLIKKSLDARITLRLIMDFLGKNKLDERLSEQYSDNEYTVEITVKERPRFSHSG